METYTEMKARHSKEFGEFEGVFFAFSIVSIGAGGYLLKNKREAFHALFNRQAAERKELKKDESKLVEALVYELSNHEYCITGNPEDALNALGLTLESVPQRVLKRAINEQNKLVIV